MSVKPVKICNRESENCNNYSLMSIQGRKTCCLDGDYVDEETEVKENPWLEKEPDDPADPVEHVIFTSNNYGGMLVLGASVRGKRHAHFGEWRDDSYGAAQVGPWTILAVADGAGSCPLSRIGSGTATSVIISQLVEHLKDFELKFETSDDTVICSNEDDLNLVLINAFTAARDALIKDAEQRGRPFYEFSTTLLAVLQVQCDGHEHVIWINVGDCILGAFKKDQTCEVLCDEDHGQMEGETNFITSPGIFESIESRVHWKTYEEPVSVLVLTTDGIADDLFPLKKKLPGLLHGDPVCNGYMYDAEGNSMKGLLYYLSDPEKIEESLLAWLNYDKLGSSYDDRTIILALKEVV